MKFRIIIFIIYILFGLNILHSQNIEPFNIVYDLNYYKSYYNYKIKTSSFVIYKLYKGGGDIPRKNMRFKSYNKLPHFNYYYSGYDRGHLVPAEDFAYSYNRLLTTFYYINCVPQTIKLNRGNWKIYETKIRQYSWKDSLIIICGVVITIVSIYTFLEGVSNWFTALRHKNVSIH